MRFFLKFSLVALLITAFTSYALPRTYTMSFPREPGPELDKQLRKNYIDILTQQQPDIVLMGDSTLVLGVDATLLSQNTARAAYSIGIPGSASAMWYLILKNNIVESRYKPQYLVVVFRDTILTAPGFRVHGSYFDLVDEYAARNEPEFIEKSFVNLMNPLEITAERFFPLYVSRSNLRREIDTGIRYFAPSLLGCDRDCTDYAMGNIFSGSDLEPNGLVDAVAAAESYLYTKDQLDFESQRDRSYLPLMIDLMQANGIQPVFVRIKVQSGDERIRSSAEFLAYMQNLSEYLAQENAPYIDLGADSRLTNDLFRDPIHLNIKGQEVFTHLLSEELKKILTQPVFQVP